MNSHQSDEGPVFTDPYMNDNHSLSSSVQGLVSYANAQDIPYISNTLYPALSDSPPGYHNHLDRAILFVSEYIITCKTNAFNNNKHGYIFSVPPGVHAHDTEYTFCNGPGTRHTTSPSFKRSNTTSSAGTPDDGSMYLTFPLYGGGRLLHLTDSGFPAVADPTANEQCRYWQQQPYKSSITPARNASANGWGRNCGR